MTRPAAIEAAMRADPSRRLTREEAAVLAAAPEQTLFTRQLLMVFHAQADAFEAALPLARAIHQEAPSPESLLNLLIVLRKAKRQEEAIALAFENEAALDAVELHGMLNACYRDLGDIPAAVRHGDEALRLKNARIGAPEDAPEPVRRRFNPDAKARNIIAFSLFGDNPRYGIGARTNAVVARYLYPDWTARFYVDAHVPRKTVQALAREGAQVFAAQDMPAPRYGLFWRFLVEDDESVDFYLIRDADSILTMKERAAVEDWIKSGARFHLMRDDLVHCELILAGMWGAQRGNIGAMGARVRAHVESSGKVLNNTTTDQAFLREKIWPILRQDVLTHSSALSFHHAQPFRDEFALPRSRHIGQNDWVFRRPRKVG